MFILLMSCDHAWSACEREANGLAYSRCPANTNGLATLLVVPYPYAVSIQSYRQHTESPYVRIQIYLYGILVNFALVHGPVICCISQELLQPYTRISKLRITTIKSHNWNKPESCSMFLRNVFPFRFFADLSCLGCMVPFLVTTVKLEFKGIS